jgi:excisionase family DNA binding protein
MPAEGGENGKVAALLTELLERMKSLEARLERMEGEGRPEGAWLTKEQVSGKFGVSERTLDRWRSRGTIEAIKVGGVVRFRPDSVEAAVAKRSKKSRRAG